MKIDEYFRQRFSLAYEKKIWAKDFEWVIGLDEAGRGPLAGPVAAAAVAIRRQKKPADGLEDLLETVNDSKRVSPGRREDLFRMMAQNQRLVRSCGMISESMIDRVNILEATKLAMEKAVRDIINKIGPGGLSACCILDGNFAINIELPQLSVVGGDRLVFCVAAASIIAKVERDRAMDRYDALYPGWGFARHKGYPTKEHLSLLKKQKPCPIHRKTFAPVTESLAR